MSYVTLQSEGRIVVEERDRDETGGGSTGEGGGENGGGTGRENSSVPDDAGDTGGMPKQGSEGSQTSGGSEGGARDFDPSGRGGGGGTRT